MKYNHKENVLYETTCGKKIWHSRSCAVATTIIANSGSDNYVLVVKRSEKMMNEPNKYCLPGGYLDWEEDLHMAAKREIFEEVGVDVDELFDKETMVYSGLHPSDFCENKNFTNQPWFVNTEDKLQNVTLHYGVCFLLDGEFPTINYDKNEVAEAFWVNVNSLHKYDFAFTHDKKIVNFIKFLRSEKLI